MLYASGRIQLLPADLQSGATLAHIYMEISSYQRDSWYAIFPHRLGRVALSSLFRSNLRATPYRRLASFLNVPSQAKLTYIALLAGHPALKLISLY